MAAHDLHALPLVADVAAPEREGPSRFISIVMAVAAAVGGGGGGGGIVDGGSELRHRNEARDRHQDLVLRWRPARLAGQDLDQRRAGVHYEKHSSTRSALMSAQ